MHMQFFYAQKKDSSQLNNDFMVVIKYDNIIENIYKTIYDALYNTNTDTKTDINYLQKIYIKTGFIIEYDNYIWNDFIKIKLNNMKLLHLIDDKFTKKILNTDILFLNYEKYKQFINLKLTDIIMKD